MHEKPLGFGRMQKKKHIFLCFWNEEIFFQNFGEK
jgi:hypothetical protein